MSREDEIYRLVNPLATAKYETDIMWGHLGEALAEMGRDYGGLEMNPDFQRGHVWSPEQQQHYIENVMRGVVTTAGLLIQLNCPNFDYGNSDYAGELPRGFQCIDGLQRVTAILGYVDGSVRPFGLSVSDFEGSAFSLRRMVLRVRVAVHDFQSRADLLRHYLDLNAGGTPHSLAEIERVRGLLANAVAEQQPSPPKSSGPSL